MFRLAHVTDPHFRSFEGAKLADFFGKRAVGALNVAVNRRRKHKMDLLTAMAEDLRSLRPDHLALTGDLSNVSLESEWRVAARWIESLEMPAEAITVIPGNHDAYVADVVERRAFENMFGAYQSGDYPFLRVAGPLALVGVNSCVPTGDLGAWGEVGDAQLRRLEQTLATAGLGGRPRVVLIHHPPVKLKGGEDRNLKDRAAFAEVLARAGAELVLHGHDHQDESATLVGPNDRSIPVVGAGSASYAGGPEKRSRYNVYDFDDKGITLTVRAHDEARDAFVEVRRLALA